ncbi:MAG: putative lipoprotein, partial [Polaromonas sp.]|nr:putative lipoprotein [Polaromonas sp.]
DTLDLAARLQLDTARSTDDLEREILLTMLLGPLAFEFPSHAEMASSVRIRRNIVLAARKTALAFYTAEADRPEDCWTYDPERGFTVRPGEPLIAALRKATQPEASGRRYAFSCYRATEYVMLLGIAQELERSNPPLLAALQRQWERRALTSEEFRSVFLHEHGAMAMPLPPRYYVPGDRVWFRNPDAHSRNATGYEGSWVLYLGGGLFTNFWTDDPPYTLHSKCLEMFQWRHTAYTDAAGDVRIDESRVTARLQALQADPAQTAGILQQMLCLRDPQLPSPLGGCLDASREFARRVCPGTADLVLPDA